ncbi:MAG: HXXEE domain-containing protein [Tabrizicola sp.]
MIPDDEAEYRIYLRRIRLLNGGLAVAACGLGLFILADPGRRCDPAWVFWLVWPMAALHTVEEYIWPGGILPWINTRSLGSATPFGPLTARRAFRVDALAGLVNPPAILGLSQVWLPGIWVFIGLLAINGAFHLSETLRTGRYFPGVATAVVLYAPGFAGVTGFYLARGLVAPWQIALGFLLALAATWAFFARLRRWRAEAAVPG